MQQIWFPKAGPPSVLQLRSADDPTPDPGEVRVAVEAAGVNFADVMARMGLYPDAPPFPMVVGYEVAGTVDALGEGVPESWLGAPVVAMTRFGGYSTKVCLPIGQVSRRPDGLDATTAAAIPVTGLTAWMLLMEFGRVREGDRVLVHSASGGVGLMVLDIAKHHGAYVAGTASGHKHEALYARGFDKLIDYRNEDFFTALSGEPPFDLVLDPVGGASWTKGLDLLRAGGKLVCYGMSSNAKSSQRSVFAVLRNLLAVPWLRINPINLMHENKSVCGVNMGRMWHESERVTGWLDELLALWSEGVLRPQVHATVPFSDAAAAHQIIHDRANVGKVVLVPD